MLDEIVKVVEDFAPPWENSTSIEDVLISLIEICPIDDHLTCGII